MSPACGLVRDSPLVPIPSNPGMDSVEPRTLEWIVEPVESAPIVPVVIEPAPESNLIFEIVEVSEDIAESSLVLV